MPRGLDGVKDGYTAACVYRPDSNTGSTVLACQSWVLDPAGVLIRSTADAPSDLFVVDAAGNQWFGVTTGEYTQFDIEVIKLVKGVVLTGLTTTSPLPARFATPITWTAQASADGLPNTVSGATAFPMGG
jgi:hypothetical protein